MYNVYAASETRSGICFVIDKLEFVDLKLEMQNAELRMQNCGIPYGND